MLIVSLTHQFRRRNVVLQMDQILKYSINILKSWDLGEREHSGYSNYQKSLPIILASLLKLITIGC